MRRVVQQGREIARQLRDPVGRQALRAELSALQHALFRTSTLYPLIRQREFAPWAFLEYWARHRPAAKALGDESDALDWRQLRREAVDWGENLRHRGVGPGTRVALIAENCIQLIVLLFAVQWLGGEILLLDVRSDVEWLTAALRQFGPSLLLVEDPRVIEALTPPPATRVLRLSSVAETVVAAGATTRNEPRHIGRATFAWLATSGTTGQPKLIRISNRRAVLSGLGMSAPCLALKPGDAIYCVLPLTHATGLLTAFSTALVAGCTLLTRRRFKTEGFWTDVAVERATCLVYVGELARYLLAAPIDSNEQNHRLRIAYGNGMALEVWHRFQSRFRIAKILEFYGATELPLALVNLGGRPGSIGRIILGHYSPWRVVERDPVSGNLIRDDRGLCVACKPDQAGELVLLTSQLGEKRCDVASRPATAAGQYMQRVTGVAECGDWGQRTGDIVTRDTNGYIAFVDRTFDVFRQKGRNVSTTHLTNVLRRFPGVAAVGVTHLKLPHYDGQLGLAVVVPAHDFSLATLEAQYARLADPVRPRLLRLTDQLRTNRAFKFDATAYRAEGLARARDGESIYVYVSGHFRPVTAEVRRQINLGHFRF